MVLRPVRTGGSLCSVNRLKALAGILLSAALAVGPAYSTSRGTIVMIGNDKGGPVGARQQRIAEMQRSGVRVEIRGDYCLSACTMYLALRNICVLPSTIFGFHGPSSRFYGIALQPDRFDHWSRVIAANYPEPIQSWYLKVGRNRTVGFYYLKGSELISMGVPKCTRN